MTRPYIAFNEPLRNLGSGISFGGAIFPNFIVKHRFSSENAIVINAPEKVELYRNVLKLRFAKCYGVNTIRVSTSKIKRIEMNF